ncbi:DNA repair protein RecO [mine drainage metagenome]|uniref:DNA repair protein RecO n=1 Tax=mine drainage metagenome TaxID=410659 RepID=T1ANK6_9ZZZZ
MPAPVSLESGYVLHARPWRETSMLLECLTPEHGRIGLVARGVRGARTQTARADLQPLRRLRLSYSRQGEMGRLHAAELVAIHALSGEALLAALYVNELLVRLLAREDAHARLFAQYQTLLEQLAGARASAWLLRRFERDLLGAMGYAPLLECEAESGVPVQAGLRYAYVPERGPLRWQPQLGGRGVSGAALLALAHDQPPATQDLPDLRRLLRELISVHLGGRALASWSLAGLARSRPHAAD